MYALIKIQRVSIYAEEACNHSRNYLAERNLAISIQVGLFHHFVDLLFRNFLAYFFEHVHELLRVHSPAKIVVISRESSAKSHDGYIRENSLERWWNNVFLAQLPH